jgi:hypothetical protein
MIRVGIELGIYMSSDPPRADLIIQNPCQAPWKKWAIKEKGLCSELTKAILRQLYPGCWCKLSSFAVDNFLIRSVLIIEYYSCANR